MDVGSNPTGSKQKRTRGRVVEGTGLIIHFHIEQHWFEPSRVYFKIETFKV
jgi:hypothetical protein